MADGKLPTSKPMGLLALREIEAEIANLLGRRALAVLRARYCERQERRVGANAKKAKWREAHEVAVALVDQLDAKLVEAERALLGSWGA